MALFWSAIVRRLRRLFRKVEFQVSRQFALSTREDRIFFALVPTVAAAVSFTRSRIPE